MSMSTMATAYRKLWMKGWGLPVENDWISLWLKSPTINLSQASIQRISATQIALVTSQILTSTWTFWYQDTNYRRSDSWIFWPHCETVDVVAGGSPSKNFFGVALSWAPRKIFGSSPRVHKMMAVFRWLTHVFKTRSNFLYRNFPQLKQENYESCNLPNLGTTVKYTKNMVKFQCKTTRDGKPNRFEFLPVHLLAIWLGKYSEEPNKNDTKLNLYKVYCIISNITWHMSYPVL